MGMYGMEAPTLEVKEPKILSGMDMDYKVAVAVIEVMAGVGCMVMGC